MKRIKISILFLLLNIIYSNTTALGEELNVNHQNKIQHDNILDQVVTKFTMVLKEKNGNDLRELLVDKEKFLPKITKHEKTIYESKLRHFGLSEDLIQEALQEMENDIISGFSNTTDFKKLLNINQEDSIENILKHPLVLKESDSSIELIFPFLKWGDGKDPDSGKAIVWIFDIKNDEPVLTDINYDYNEGRTKKSLRKDFGEIWFVLQPIRSLESFQQYFQLSISIETTEKNLPSAERNFEKIKKEIKFPEKIGPFTAGYNAMTEPSTSESQIGKRYFYTLYLDYSKEDASFGATILSDIEIDVLGDKLQLEQPIVLYKPRD